MKYLIMFFLVPSFIFQNTNAQKRPPLGYYQSFYLGMTQQEFVEMCKGKYEPKLTTYQSTYLNGKKYEPAKFNMDVCHLQIKIPENRIGEVTFDNFEFYFINKLLYKIEIYKPEKTITLKESESVIKRLNSLYGSQYKAIFDLKPNKKEKRYKGSRTYCSEPKIKGKVSPLCNSIWFSYQPKEKYGFFRPNRIVIKDNSVETYWAEFVKMTKHFEKQNLKAYNSFRGLNLGMSLAQFKEKMGNKIRYAPDSTVERAYKDSKHKDAFLKYEAYFEQNPATLMGVKLNEVDYFFYENKLAVIRIIIDFSTNLHDFEKNLVQVFGKPFASRKDGTSVRSFEIKNKQLDKTIYEFWLELVSNSKTKALIYRDNKAFNKLLRLVKEENKEKLKNDF